MNQRFYIKFFKIVLNYNYTIIIYHNNTIAIKPSLSRVPKRMLLL